MTASHGPLAAIAFATSLSAQAACPLPPDTPSVLGKGAVQASWRATPQPVRVGEPFALVITLCPADATLVRVDATMPEHRHGMNYRPSIQAIGPGQWRVEGLVWHMAGRWELKLDAALAGSAHTLTQSVTLK